MWGLMRWGLAPESEALLERPSTEPRLFPAAKESRWYLYKPKRVPSTNSGVNGAGSGAGAALLVDNIRARPNMANKV